MRAAIAISPKTQNKFVRAAFCVAASKLEPGGVAHFAKERFPGDAELLDIVRRSAVLPATTTATGWAAELALTTAYREFLASLAPASAASRLIANGVTISLSGLASVKIPQRTGSPSILPWAAEAAPIAVVQRPLEGVPLGPPKKIAAITVLTDELSRHSDAERVFELLLREDCALSIDAAYFSTTAGSASAHAGLLNGITPIAASAASSTDEAMKQDLSALMTAVATGGSGTAALIMATERAASFPVRAPELAGQLTILPSPAVLDDRVIAADPASILHATGAPRISVSRDAVVHLEDTNPAQIGVSGSPNVVAAPSTSLFQSAQVGLKVTADIAFAKRRSSAVAFIDGVTW